MGFQEFNALNGYILVFQQQEINKPLVKCWAEICDSSLKIYSNFNDNDCINNIRLSGCDVSKVFLDGIEGIEPELFIRLSQCSGETFHFTLNDENDLNVWFNILQKLSQPTSANADAATFRSQLQCALHYGAVTDEGFVGVCEEEPDPYSISDIADAVEKFNSPDENSKECDSLRDLPQTGIREKYHTNGLIKRMSIAASDLLGKPHDELVILLIQLNREKAKLKQWQDHYKRSVQQLTAEMSLNLAARKHAIIKDQLFQQERELNDIEKQLRLSQPLISFVDNIVRMGSLFGGKNSLFVSEYEPDFMAANARIPAKQNINFIRKLQEREIISACSETYKIGRAFPVSYSSHTDVIGRNSSGFSHYPLEVSNARPDSIALMLNDPQHLDNTQFVNAKLRLQTQLEEIQNILNDCPMTDNNPDAFHARHSPTSSVVRLRSGIKPERPLSSNATSVSAMKRKENLVDSKKFPKRSTRRFKQSDITSSQRYRHESLTSQTDVRNGFRSNSVDQSEPGLSIVQRSLSSAFIPSVSSKNEGFDDAMNSKFVKPTHMNNKRNMKFSNESDTSSCGGLYLPIPQSANFEEYDDDDQEVFHMDRPSSIYESLHNSSRFHLANSRLHSNRTAGYG